MSARFSEFWDSLPAKRRSNKKGCLEKWEAKKLDTEADRILKWVRAMSKTDEWKKGYNPAPMTIINQERWNDGHPEFKTPEFKEEVKTISVSDATKWVMKNKDLTQKQINSGWNWIYTGGKEGVLVGVCIPADDPMPSYRIMFDDMYDLSEGVPGV